TKYPYIHHKGHRLLWAEQRRHPAASPAGLYCRLSQRKYWREMILAPHQAIWRALVAFDTKLHPTQWPLAAQSSVLLHQQRLDWEPIYHDRPLAHRQDLRHLMMHPRSDRQVSTTYVF